MPNYIEYDTFLNIQFGVYGRKIIPIVHCVNSSILSN